MIGNKLISFVTAFKTAPHELAQPCNGFKGYQLLLLLLHALTLLFSSLFFLHDLPELAGHQ